MGCATGKTDVELLSATPGGVHVMLPNGEKWFISGDDITTIDGIQPGDVRAILNGIPDERQMAMRLYGELSSNGKLTIRNAA